MSKNKNKDKKEDIHKQFKTNRSPKRVFQMGAFGGTYFRPIDSSVTGKSYKSGNVIREFKDWFKGMDIENNIRKI